MSARHPSARTSDPLADLAAALGRRPPESLATLPRAALDDLARAVHHARTTQAEHLAGALDSALRVAPRPLRGLLRRLLVG
jgi:hypothetical protein